MTIKALPKQNNEMTAFFKPDNEMINRIKFLVHSLDEYGIKFPPESAYDLFLILPEVNWINYEIFKNVFRFVFVKRKKDIEPFNSVFDIIFRNQKFIGEFQKNKNKKDRFDSKSIHSKFINKEQDILKNLQDEIQSDKTITETQLNKKRRSRINQIKRITKLNIGNLESYMQELRSSHNEKSKQLGKKIKTKSKKVRASSKKHFKNTNHALRNKLEEILKYESFLKTFEEQLAFFNEELKLKDLFHKKDSTIGSILFNKSRSRDVDSSNDDLNAILKESRSNEFFKYIMRASSEEFRDSIKDLYKVLVVKNENSARSQLLEDFFKMKNEKLIIIPEEQEKKSLIDDDSRSSEFPGQHERKKKSILFNKRDKSESRKLKLDNKSENENLQTFLVSPDLIRLFWLQESVENGNNLLLTEKELSRLRNRLKNFLRNCAEKKVSHSFLLSHLARFSNALTFIQMFNEFIVKNKELLDKSLLEYQKSSIKVPSSKKNTYSQRSSEKDFHKISYEIGRALATNPGGSYRKHKKGFLDYRRLFRENARTNFVPVYLAFKNKKIIKPKLTLLCDVSYSVSEYIKFYLSFFYAIQNFYSSINTFTFIDIPINVTRYFKNNSFESAFSKIMELKLMDQWRKSDYGTCFKLFKEKFSSYIDSNTVFIIAGDARNNYYSELIKTFYELSKKAHCTIWMNPEPNYKWDTGDSIISHYSNCCDHVFSCSRPSELLHLTKFDILRLNRNRKRKISFVNHERKRKKINWRRTFYSSSMFEDGH
ncbi:MAG: VWA domain-containing protein [Candidatus Helarchaeota archaeon]